jgi:hypothetical protein
MKLALVTDAVTDNMVLARNSTESLAHCSLHIGQSG